MAKKDRFRDAYSGGFPPVDESEGSGSSGRVDRNTSAYDSTSGPRRKWIKLSSAFRDGFGVPIHVLPLSKLSLSERKSLVLHLRTELEHIRMVQRKFDSGRAHVVPVSSSSDILSCNSAPKGLQATNVRKQSVPASGPGKRVDESGQKTRGWNRGLSGRFESANGSSAPRAFNAGLMKQCENLLAKLMAHQFGWVFNEPVDVVKLKIPDYFNIIKHPMDLGTIMKKISSCQYSSPMEFLADVRLTFSNAMTYNDPGNDVHIMASTLSKFFELRWKTIAKILPPEDSQQLPAQEEIDMVKPNPPAKKRKIASLQSKEFQEPVKHVMTSEEKHNLSRELEAQLGDLPDNIIDFLREQSFKETEAGEDEIEIDIDDLADDTLFALRKLLDDHLQEKQKHAKAEPCVIELLNESGLSNSTMQLYKGNDLVDEEVDIGGNEPPVSSYPPIEIEKDDGNINHRRTSSGSSSDSGSNNSSQNGLDNVKASSPVHSEKENFVSEVELDDKECATNVVENQSVSGLDQLEQISLQKPNSVESDSRKDDGESAPIERQVSPDKLYRAALLKNRFADTILKAREKTLNQGEKGDPEKLRREKEELENQKRKEKARLQAEAKAAEDARRRAEAEAAAKVKRKRDLEREAARQALLKMEKTVEIDETSRFLKDLEMLRTVPPEQLPSSVDEMIPDEHSLEGLGSFKFGDSNPLEQLGLYMKMDEEEEEGEPPSSIPNGGGDDVEEGEID